MSARSQRKGVDKAKEYQAAKAKASIVRDGGGTGGGEGAARVEVLTRQLAAYGQQRRLGEALGVFQEIQRQGLTPTRCNPAMHTHTHVAWMSWGHACMAGTHTRL